MLHAERHACLLELLYHLPVGFHLAVDGGRVFPEGIGKVREATCDFQVRQPCAELGDFLLLTGEEPIPAEAGIQF